MKIIIEGALRGLTVNTIPFLIYSEIFEGAKQFKTIKGKNEAISRNNKIKVIFT